MALNLYSIEGLTMGSDYDFNNSNIIDHTYSEPVHRWIWTLNNWDWPFDLPGKPSDWDDLPWYTVNIEDRTRYELIADIQDRVRNLISRKDELKYHNKYHIDYINYNDKGFEVWYSLHFNNLEPDVMEVLQEWLENNYYNEKH